MARLGAEALHRTRGVVAAEGGEIDGFDGVDQPGSLVLFFNGAARGHGRSAALDSTAIDAHILNGAKVKFGAGIAVTILMDRGLTDGKQ